MGVAETLVPYAQMTAVGLFEDDDLLELILTQLPLQDGINLLKTSKERYYNSEIGAKYIVDKAKTIVDNARQKWDGISNSWLQIANRIVSIMMTHRVDDHIVCILGITAAKGGH